MGFRGSFPRPPCWGKNNDLEQWWNINDFKILCASYRHEVEGFLKTVSPYFSRGPKSDDDFPKPRTPTRVTGWSASVSELPAPQRVKVPRFGCEDSDIPPISTITGQGRLATLLEDDTIKISPTKAETWGSGPLLRMACTSPMKFHWFFCKMTQRN